MDDDIIDYTPDTPNPRAAHKSQDPEDTLTPLEQELLDEYAKLVGNLDDLSDVLAELARRPSVEILDALRGLERRTTTVFMLLKASVYSIVLQQEIADGDGEGDGDGGVGEGVSE